AATALDTLLQVISDEPVPLRQLQSKVPRDLETICLKCLQKEPGKRYGRAGELAEDLRRFQAREPIAARPVGAVERGWRWCRRNPVVAGLLGAVAATLLLGVAVASSLAVVARHQAQQAEHARQQEAERATSEARAKDEADAARKQAEADRQ